MSEGLGNRLNALRGEHGLTQAALAERVGVSRKTINTVENGVFIPSTLLALKIARALDRPVESIFYLDDRGVSSPESSYRRAKASRWSSTARIRSPIARFMSARWRPHPDWTRPATITSPGMRSVRASSGSASTLTDR